MYLHISTSIGDFPVFSDIEDSFRKAKSTGVDGVELVMGFKSRWHFAKVLASSQKYKLPITSVHQPYWSGLDIAYDEGFVAMVAEAGIKHIVFHPLCFQSMYSKRMKHYFSFLSRMQTTYGVSVMLENMTYEKNILSLDHWVVHKNTSKLEIILSIAQQYHFLCNYDVSHTKWVRPHEHEEFKKIFPLIGNIHMSSFTHKQQHMPLTMGDFDTKTFIQFLSKNGYKGLLTFEIFYPQQFPLRKFDWEEIKKSVEIIRSISGKS